MNHAARLPLYRQIEAERESRVIAYVTGERVGLQTAVAPDAVTPFVSVLDAIGPVDRLSLVLDTSGGDALAAWRLINLIRSFCEELEVIVPTKAMSAGTLMALGANRIVMTKQGALGPIDPSLTSHPLAPTATLAGGQTIQVPISAEAVRSYIEEVKKDVTDPVAMATVWTHLASLIHPVVLGDIFRSGSQIRMLAGTLIKSQVSDPSKQTQIINLLCSESGSHDYTINRRHAADIGLNVEKPSAELYNKFSAITKSYNDELKTLEPFSPQGLLAGKSSVNFSLVRGLIESTDVCFGFVTEGQLGLQSGPSGPPQLVEQSTTGWRKLP